jgi:hypothetical protein
MSLGRAHRPELTIDKNLERVSAGEIGFSVGCCHTNLIPAARCLEGPLRLRPQWRLATSGTLRL